MNALVCTRIFPKPYHPSGYDFYPVCVHGVLHTFESMELSRANIDLFKSYLCTRSFEYHINEIVDFFTITEEEFKESVEWQNQNDYDTELAFYCSMLEEEPRRKFKDTMASVKANTIVTVCLSLLKACPEENEVRDLLQLFIEFVAGNYDMHWLRELVPMLGLSVPNDRVV